MKNIYITTTLPYVNSDPHIGFALEIVQADVFARYNKLMGREVFFNTGTDEHGVKIFRKAESLGIDPQKYVDEYAEKFRNLQGALNLYQELHFIRTSEPRHKKAAQEFWKRCEAKGDIYKKNYKIKYCVGCELEKTDSELVDGKCPIHPNLTIEIIEEENYFFRFSNYQKPLLKLYKERPDFVVPDFRFNEIKAFVERGLEDFSISRLKTKMPWGVEVPIDPTHVMYVWFDALVSYISTIGWPENDDEFKKWWPVIQFAGKDNLRQQSAMWQSMLMSAGIEPSRQIVIHGFINSGGQKMSKSLGNVIDPYAVVNEYGTDALRYYLLREVHPFEDSDFTMEKFKEAYNANLANGLGNLVSRVLKLTTLYDIRVELKSASEVWNDSSVKPFRDFIENYEQNKAMDFIWQRIAAVDRSIQETEPFKKLKDPLKKDEGVKIMTGIVSELWCIAVLLEPAIPQTSKIIQQLLKENKMPEKPLFMRKD